MKRTTRPTSRFSTSAARSRLATAVALSLAALTLGACGDDDDASGVPPVGSDPDQNPVGSIPTGQYAVARNASGTPGSVFFYAPDAQTATGSLMTGANEGIAFDASGAMYQNGDGALFMGMRAFGQVDIGADDGMFGNTTDREMGGANGKGLAVVGARGLLVSCDVTAADADLKIYATTAGSGAQPIATIDMPAPVWDVFYHAGADRLYAAQTDGVLAVFDDFSTSVGNGPNRSITPVDGDGSKLSVNFHGVYAEGDALVVTDVGDAASASDGAVFVFTDDGSLDGNVGGFTRIAGDATRLGNPVDVVLKDGSAIVAEKSNDALLVFNQVGGRGGEVAPDFRVDFLKPESIEIVPQAGAMPDVSDLDSATPLSAVAVSLNPGVQQGVGNDDVGRIRLLDANLGDAGVFDLGQASGGMSTGMRTLENVQFDAQGNAYAVFDVTDGSTVSDRGIAVIHQLAARAGASLEAPDRDRTIGGMGLGLNSPKGIEVVGSRGRMIVADTGGAGSLRVYSLAAGEGASPVFTVDAVGQGAIWDIDYDPQSDRLYAAGTAGDILVYDDFFATGAGAVPTRTIRPDSAGATSNMHGIVHVAATDQLIVSDVGDAAVADDGRIYVIDAASTATGTVTPRTTIAGAATLLGNPVDLAFDGSSLYVAEKSNDRLLVFTDVLARSGNVSAAADRAVALAKPESVSLRPQP